jgi:hypothetical protein
MASQPNILLDSPKARAWAFAAAVLEQELHRFGFDSDEYHHTAMVIIPHLRKLSTKAEKDWQLAKGTP